jgi:hypothetical protein
MLNEDAVTRRERDGAAMASLSRPVRGRGGGERRRDFGAFRKA